MSTIKLIFESRVGLLRYTLMVPVITSLLFYFGDFQTPHINISKAQLVYMALLYFMAASRSNGRHLALGSKGPWERLLCAFPHRTQV